MDVFEGSSPPGGLDREGPSEWTASELLARVLRAPPKRRTPPRLRVFFLRQLRQCGEVSLAAKRTGVPLSTLYRWRERDAAFRGRWDDILLQRRQIVEDRLMSIVREGELHTVYYKGLEVGWRRTFTHRVAIRTLDYLDRRANSEIRHTASHSAVVAPVKNPEGSAT